VVLVDPVHFVTFEQILLVESVGVLVDSSFPGTLVGGDEAHHE